MPQARTAVGCLLQLGNAPLRVPATLHRPLDREEALLEIVSRPAVLDSVSVVLARLRQSHD